MREIVRQLAQLFPTAIISGRGREKLEKFVQLKEMFYAGSHGLDIVGPRVRSASNARHLGNFAILLDLTPALEPVSFLSDVRGVLGPMSRKRHAFWPLLQPSKVSQPRPMGCVQPLRHAPVPLCPSSLGMKVQ